MAAEENEELKENVEVDSENISEEENEISEDQLAETMISEGLEGSSDDDLEAQMAAAMAADSLESSDEEDDLEAQMATAMEQDSKIDGGMIDEGMLNSIPDDASSSVSAIPVDNVSFEQLAPSDESVNKDNINRLLDIGLNLSVELGRKEMRIKEILELGPGKIIELDKLAGEPVDLLVNGKLLAKGEVVVVDENFGVRITELIDPVDRLKILN